MVPLEPFHSFTMELLPLLLSPFIEEKPAFFFPQLKAMRCRHWVTFPEQDFFLRVKIQKKQTKTNVRYTA